MTCSGLSQEYPTPACPNACTEKAYPTTYPDDKHKSGGTSYAVTGGVDAIRAEIEARGPVTAQMTAYNDLYTYKSGTSWCPLRRQRYHDVKQDEIEPLDKPRPRRHVFC
jgi:hypothetical protein